MQIVYRAENLIDAHLVRGRLQADGVPAWLLGEHLSGGIGELPATGLLAVCVADGDVEAAERSLAAIRESSTADAPESGWLRSDTRFA